MATVTDKSQEAASSSPIKNNNNNNKTMIDDVPFLSSAPMVVEYAKVLTAAQTSKSSKALTLLETDRDVLGVFVRTNQKVEKEWKQNYNLLVALKKVTKTANNVSDTDPLHKWVQRQHFEYTVFLNILEGRAPKRNSTTSMNETKMRMLRDVGFVFTKGSVEGTGNKRELMWDARADLLRKYRDKHGDTLVPKEDKNLYDDEREEFKGLGQWVAGMRSKMRLYGTPDADPYLTAFRMQRLLDIGVSPLVPRSLKRKVWTDDEKHQARKKPKVDVKWERSFAVLQKFKEEHGHIDVPRNCPEYNKLRNWMGTQKSEYRKVKEGKPTSLTAYKLKKLADVGFSIERRKLVTYEDHLQQWLDYRKKFGRDPLREDEEGDTGLLTNWIAKIRENYRAKSLTQQRIDQLTQLGFVWCASKDPEKAAVKKPWETRFIELKQYVENHGHAMVPHSYPELGEFVKRMRKQYKAFSEGRKSCMTQEKVDKLNSVGFVWVARGISPGRNRSVFAKQQAQSATTYDLSSDEDVGGMEKEQSFGEEVDGVEEDQFSDEDIEGMEGDQMHHSSRRNEYANQQNSRVSDQDEYASSLLIDCARAHRI